MLRIKPGDDIGYMSYDSPEYYPVLAKGRSRFEFVKVPGVSVGIAAMVLPFGVVLPDSKLVWGCCIRTPF